ncbi:MAG: SUMF1/EgtB/PvdO family nonheme iron enzyme [Verrucomicrobia bacterium]|nr:SUMF1/EgtB/PvdO family nonheme iron enzyme [Verrucomicrobiota bacterium]
MRELMLRDYEILSELGRGAMGVVYKARQYSLDRVVALKVLAPELARDQAYIERFKREAIIAATITHPNIVTVYEAGAHLNLDTGERLHYFVMEYVEGETVQQRLARQNRIPADEVAAIGARVAEGLESAWKKARIIHRDIKPSNIFLSNDGDVKIGDLGLARVAGDAQSSLTATGAIIGTAYYMSPEQARGKDDMDFRSDIYSLGCALYRMLCGKHPFEGAFADVIVQHLTERPPNIRTIVPNCPISIVRVIEKMLAKDPSGRQQTYAELIEDLRQAHERIMFRDPQQADRARTTASASRKQMACVAGGIAAVAVIAGMLRWSPWQQSGPGVSPDHERRTGILPVSSPTNGQGERLSHTALQKPAEEKAPPPPPPVVATAAKPAAKVAAVTTPGAATNPPPAGGTPVLPAKRAAKTAPVATDSFAKEVAALPLEQQVARVVAKLKELNPAFDGKETHKIENGAVTELALSTVGVADIAPLKALPRLQKLAMAPATVAQKGALSDLSPIKGLPLTWLYCQGNPIRDISPIRDMPLTVLSLGVTQVSDLSPLAGMQLAVLSINDTAVGDLSPLAGMPLTTLWCNNTKVTDLSPLRDMPLKELRCDYVAARDAAILRGIKLLATINDVAAAVFWQREGPAAASAATALARVQAGQPFATSIGVELVAIPPGEFMLGSTPEEREWAMNPRNGGSNNLLVQVEGAQPRKAAIQHGFWLGRTEVTVEQWRQFAKATNYETDGEKAGVSFARKGENTWSSHVEGANWKNPHFEIETRDDHPVCCISWNDAMAFCAWLDKMERSKGRLPAGCKIRLPTEAEWEYACRAGQQTKFWWGDSVEDGEDRLHWRWRWIRGTPESVATVDHYGPRGRNKFGLADMLGNVCEWCLDGFDSNGAHAKLWTGGESQHVVKGGSLVSLSAGLPRCAWRESRAASFSSAAHGFRVACGPAPAEIVPKTETNRPR